LCEINIRLDIIGGLRYNKGKGEVCFMATNNEMRIWQKDMLFKLLLLEKEAGKTKELTKLIVQTKAVMEAEDVAWVEKKVAEI
jgi:hypothetical protein